MNEEFVLPALTAENLDKYKLWWTTLTDSWKIAFNAVYTNAYTTDLPGDDTLNLISNVPVMRFAGPTAMYPNMQTELDDMSGISQLNNLKILVVVNHNVKSLKGIEGLQNLESLFVFENKISDISSVSSLPNLKEFYFQSNLVTSLKDLSQNLNLRTIYCSRNKLENLEGISEQHADQLTNFICLPNELLKDRDIIQFENKVGIRCNKG